MIVVFDNYSINNQSVAQQGEHTTRGYKVDDTTRIKDFQVTISQEFQAVMELVKYPCVASKCSGQCKCS